MNKKPVKKTAKKAVKKAAKKGAKVAKKAKKVAKKAKKARQGSFKKVNKKLKVLAKAVTKAAVGVEEASSGKQFIIVINGKRKMFSLGEMRQLVTISHAGSGDAERGAQIYTWMKRNRRDVLLDTEIASPRHPAFSRLSGILRKRYKVKRG